MHGTRHPLPHDHAFGQDARRPGESRTLLVIVITAVMMVVEIAAGWIFGSMALLADGLHMGSHATALTVTWVAYVYARRHARDARFSFGTGKVNALGGFASAVLLVLFALLMISESVERFIHPREIRFDEAVAVAVAGLVVNAVCAWILAARPGHPHQDHDHDHHQHHHHGDHGHSHGHGQDHNLRAAYLHVLADATTSVLAIVALLTAKHLGLTWMDPLMGVVGAGLVARWSVGLLRDTGGILLDRQAPPEVLDSVRRALESGGDRVADLHVWSVGPGLLAASVSVVSPDPQPPEHYKDRLPAGLGVVHATVEVHPSGG